MAVIVKILRSFDSSNYWVKDSSYSSLLLILLFKFILLLIFLYPYRL